MPEKYNLTKLFEEIEEDKKVKKVIKKKWASQEDIKELALKKKKRQTSK